MELLRQAMHVILLFILVFVITAATIIERLIFEAFTKGPPTAYSLFMGTAVANGNNVTKEHFKDCFINDWEKHDIKTVTIMIMAANEIKAYIVFNGTQTNKISWMTQDRIIDSSYTDIKTTVANYFSIEGFSKPTLHRYFYINHQWGGCQKDTGWLILKHGIGDCEWENLVPSNQTLVLYSNLKTLTKYNSKKGVADSMRITVAYTDPCRLYDVDNQKNVTVEELEREVQKLKQQLQVSKQGTSSYIRKRTSAEDRRPSSMVFGIVAGVVITFVIGIPVASDCINVLKFCAAKRAKKTKIFP